MMRLFIISISLVAGCLFAAREKCIAQRNSITQPFDAGVSYTPRHTTFKVWSPQADTVKLRLYNSGIGGRAIKTHYLIKQAGGYWSMILHQQVKNIYYTFQVYQDGKWLNESPDIYATAVGINGKRGMIVDLKETDPVGWKNDRKPFLKSPTDIIIYETHIRDLTISHNSGNRYKGKFLGLAETGTKSAQGEKTGLDHLKELGITHVHLLPSFDFSSVDETGSNASYNWGYDPLNYNVPEGSYATNATDGHVRIKEFKEMVQALHKNGIRVILDVVYNHTTDRNTFSFNQFAPDYFYRHNPDGSYSDATACGNETASEKEMMRNLMISSVVYWAREYHLDGFRFDLMGVHDITTMNAISDTLHKIDPTIFIYGEGWTAGASPLDESLRAVKKNTGRLHHIAAFSDDLRDGLRGPFNNVKEKGFVSGAAGTAESVKFGIVASVPHPQINYRQINHSDAPWAAEPAQAIAYASCHDDNTLYDRLKIANPGATEAELIKMDKLANAIVLTSQGVPFLHSGAELLRTKKGVANSYNAPDSVNEIDWSRKTTYKSVFNYYRQLMTLRKAHPAFRMPSAKMINDHLAFLPVTDSLVIAYQISSHANGDPWKNIIVLLNGNRHKHTMQLPAGKWYMALSENGVMQQSGLPVADKVNLPATSAYILFQKD